MVGEDILPPCGPRGVGYRDGRAGGGEGFLKLYSQRHRFARERKQLAVQNVALSLRVVHTCLLQYREVGLLPVYLKSLNDISGAVGPGLLLKYLTGVGLGQQLHRSQAPVPGPPYKGAI